MPEINKIGETHIVIVSNAPDAYDNGKIDNSALIQGVRAISNSDSPIRTDKHDFWVVHPYPLVDLDLTSNYQDKTSFVKGIIQMMAPDLNQRISTRMATQYLRVFAEEVGHHWLVPEDMKIDSDPVYAGIEFMQALQNGGPIPRLCLLGRGKPAAHWSSYLASGSSPLEALPWQLDTELTWREPGNLFAPLRTSPFHQYTLGNPSGIPVTVPNLRNVEGPTYNDLDKYIMGRIDAGEAYPDRDGTFEYVRPVWLSPTNMHCGLVLLSGHHEGFIFGFYEGFDKVRVTEIGSENAVNGAEWHIRDLYQPWDGQRRLMLRVVHRDSAFHFQAKLGEPQVSSSGCLLMMRRAPTETGWTNRLERISPPVNDPGDLLDWQTLTSVDENRAGNLLAGGYILSTWEDQPPTVEGNFRDLHVAGQFVGGDEYSAIIKPYTDRILNSWSPEELSGAVMTFIRPKPGPRLREVASGAAIYLASSWVNKAGTEFNHVGAFPLTKSEEEAPMLLVLLPGRRGFFLGGSVYLNRAMLVPWAAGAISLNSTLWGWREMESVSKIELGDSDSDRRAYKKISAAFIIVTDGSRSSVPGRMINYLEKFRNASSTWFEAATGLPLDTTVQ